MSVVESKVDPIWDILSDKKKWARKMRGAFEWADEYILTVIPEVYKCNIAIWSIPSEVKADSKLGYYVIDSPATRGQEPKIELLYVERLHFDLVRTGV